MSQDFKPHPVLSNYEASRDSVVRNRKLMKPVGCMNNSGYLRFTVGKKTCYIYRTIYECYNGLIEDGLVIDHIDGCPQNNSLNNLRAVTQSQNTQVGKTGIYPKHPKGISFDTTTNGKKYFSQ